MHPCPVDFYIKNNLKLICYSNTGENELEIKSVQLFVVFLSFRNFKLEIIKLIYYTVYQSCHSP